jgi:hypothetical protein
MNRKTRRARKAARKWLAGYQKAHDEARGIWDMQVFFPQHVLSLTIEALAGDTTAALMLEQLDVVSNMIQQADPPTLCMLCDHVFRRGDAPPTAFVIVSPHVDMPEQGIGSGLCHACVEPGETLMQRVAQCYKDRVMHDLRVLPPASPPGHA